MLRRAYHWVAQWSETPYGNWALFCFAFAESSFFPIPPDILLMALCTGKPSSAFEFALICSLGSILGGIAGYAMGMFAFATIGFPILSHYDPNQVIFEKVRHLYETWGFWGVLMAAITPIPYKVFTIASGVFRFNFSQFVLASVLGRSFRFFLEGGLIFWGGEPLKIWIDTYFDKLAWAFLALAGLGFVLLKFL